jgi:lipocalin
MFSCAGLWYETHRTAGLSFEEHLVCVTANYTKQPDGHFTFNNTAHNCKTNRTQSVAGDIERRDEKLSSVAKFAVRFSHFCEW